MINQWELVEVEPLFCQEQLGAFNGCIKNPNKGKQKDLAGPEEKRRKTRRHSEF